MVLLDRRAVHNFRVENNAIYFTPIEIRQINDPAIYPPTEPTAFYFDFSATLYACDHDGGNIRAVYTHPTGEMDFDSYGNRKLVSGINCVPESV